MKFWRKFFGGSKSATVAKRRLQMVLVQDRTGISATTLDILKDEIINVIAKYVDIDRSKVEVSVAYTEQGHKLTADIPVIGEPDAVRHPPPRGARRD